MYAIICTDKENALEIRKANRAAHIAFLAETPVVFAGPFQDETGAMTGSLIVVDVETRADVETWAANDPYAKAGLFEKVRIERFSKVIG
ncbi:MAG: hypothetical protein CSA74_05680 [Rhodobacterales bacterium]|nr:MAG: hypothetical protein CSA74_05680 [Rhodobacterales bacterium]